MLVTCPECGTKISERANPCPRCGLPSAGARSKEHCEWFVQWLLEQREVTVESSDRRRICLCWSGYHFYVRGKVSRTEIRKSDGGYYIAYWVSCSKCGKESEEVKEHLF